MPVHGINFRDNEVYEGGATLVTLLAYPTDDESDSQRAMLHRCLCHLALRARAEHDEAWANVPQPIKPIYAIVSPSELNKALRTLERRLRDRMTAGHMAVPFLQASSTGREPPLPDGVKRLSINQLSEFVLGQLGQSESGNVEARIWRPSLPVIHLAAATQVLIQTLERNGTRAPHVGDLVVNRMLIEWVIREARAYEAIIAKSDKFGIEPKNLVRLRLAKG